ncbi:hypothetical protein ALP73_200297 [Pseudomonas coronafaciens pv. garcae]|nr:hypothetical protein ALP73_200297 [Pseudomonas coronafaciens pv. garcae]
MMAVVPDLPVRLGCAKSVRITNGEASALLSPPSLRREEASVMSDYE